MGFYSKSSWGGDDTTRAAGKLLPLCGQCGLKPGCRSPMMEVAGAGRVPIMYVGEAPGAEEDKRGESFIGPAGQVLRTLASLAGLDIDQGWKSNSIICRPPGNKIEDLNIECCRPNLLNAIARLRPRVIVLLGLSAVQSLIGGEWGGSVGPMARWAGWTIPSAKYGAWLCPTFHPSYVMREESPLLERFVVDHLRAAANLVDVPCRPLDVAKLTSEVEIIRSPRDAKLRLSDLSRKRGLAGFDYETTGLKPERAAQKIVSVAFSHEGRDTFSCVVDRSTHGSLRAVLKNPKLLKVGANIKFEERWSRTKLGVPVAGWDWDTMLAAHMLDNRGKISSVKFQAYVQFGVADYNKYIKDDLEAEDANDCNNIEEVHLDDLLPYCGLDALIEFKLMERQRETLGWAR